jgi:hypothetical protein
MGYQQTRTHATGRGCLDLVRRSRYCVNRIREVKIKCCVIQNSRYLNGILVTFETEFGIFKRQSFRYHSHEYKNACKIILAVYH